MRKRPVDVEEQGRLFAPAPGQAPPRRTPSPDERWKMPVASGSTVAEIRLRWAKRLTPAQVAKVEAELQRVAVAFSKLGFGPVELERAFVRRRKQD